ncbi:NTP transferase domain-containing protein [Brevibacterium sandarakinum]|uniref:nucleotidyltransferase family protein n=1 Tax=Brevibacterium sandarakinum TaxID=629680 RepID=UPI00350E3F2B
MTTETAPESVQGPMAGSAVGQGPVGLVLAAGAGRRLGLGPKALLRGNGRTLVECLVDALLSGGCRNVTVVTGAGAEEVATILRGSDQVRVARNRRWAEGMGSSLQCGLQTIGPGTDVLVTPVDRPGICAEEVERLIAAHRPGAITAAAHRDEQGQLRRGHPVVFDAMWTAEVVTAAHDDVGARQLLTAHRDIVELVDCSDLDDGEDIDVPADLHRLKLLDRSTRHCSDGGSRGDGRGGDGSDGNGRTVFDTINQGAGHASRGSGARPASGR